MKLLYPLGASERCQCLSPFFRYRIWEDLYWLRLVDPLGLVSISKRVTIFPKEGKPFLGCYSLRFDSVHPLAEVCFGAFAGSTLEYRRSAMLSLTVSTDPS